MSFAATAKNTFLFEAFFFSFDNPLVIIREHVFVLGPLLMNRIVWLSFYFLFLMKGQTFPSRLIKLV
jgi:hypothetical protein